MDVLNRRLGNPFKKRYSRFPVYDDKQDALPRFPRNDEVGLGIADLLSRIDIPWPLVDERTVQKKCRWSSSSPTPLSSQETMRFNPSAVYALDEPVNAVFGNRWQILSIPCYISRDGLG